MSHSEQPLRVIGHKNPDTDSICSAIASAHFKLEVMGEEKIIHAITYPKAGEKLFEMVGVLSRKKQMMPYLVDLLKGL